MKKRVEIAVAAAVIMSVLATPSIASYRVLYDFESDWEGSYVPGWENTPVESGEAPVGVMMEHYYAGYGGGNAVRVIAVDAPDDAAFWADVSPMGYDEVPMSKQYDPYVKVMYYDEGFNTEESYDSSLHRAGQLFSVPDVANSPSSSTDAQLGAGAANGDSYFYANYESTGQSVTDTGVARTEGWHELKMQLLNEDGKIHFFIDGDEVGSTVRDDYENLLGFGLSTMYTPSLSDWKNGNPSTIWDDFEYGSSYVPEPMTLSLLGLGGLVVLRRRKS